jgi:hypothetical protein
VRGEVLKFYFLKLSKISFAISFHHNQNANHHAIANIEINQIKTVLIIILSIQILFNTTINVKNNITTLAHEAIILAVLSFVKLNE